MNKYFIEEYKLGDLIAIQDTSYLGMVVNKKPGWSSSPVAELAYMYKVHFCGEQEPDQRWLLADAIKRIE